jgi:anti-anti-sigma factor
LTSTTGLRHGDHACWTFADAADFGAAVVPFLDEGRQRGEQLLVTGGSRTELLDALGPLPGRDALLAGGRLGIRSTDELYGPGGELDPVARAAGFRAEVDAALAGGRTGLRVAADLSSLARAGPEARHRLYVYERHADSVVGGAPLTGLCLYSASLGEGVLGPLAVLHALQHDGDREPLAHLSGRGRQLALIGEVDRTLTDDVFEALVHQAGGARDEIVLDLSGLTFLDVAGARMLTRAVAVLGEAGVRLRLVRPRRLVARALALFDVDAGQVEPVCP